MAKFSLKKYPKKPKANASNDVLQNYLNRCKDVDKHNAEVKRAKEQNKKLRSQVAKVGRVK